MTTLRKILTQSVLIEIEGLVTAGVYEHDCMINMARGVNFNSDTSEELMIECDSPNSPAFKEIFIDGLQMEVTGGGKLQLQSFGSFWFPWYKGGLAKNCRVNFPVASAFGGGYFQVPLKLTQLQSQGERNQYMNASLTLLSHGSFDWVAAAA